MSLEEAQRELERSTACSCPGGFGSRGWEGKILACRVAREHWIPYLGICLGMHVAVSEFARHVVGLEGANSTEMDPETPYPGDRPAPRAEGGRGPRRHDAPRCAGGRDRRGHAHARDLRRAGRSTSVTATATRSTTTTASRSSTPASSSPGTFQEGRLVEIVELPDHPWFVASQFHPEFKSRPTRPAPLFREFVGAAHDRARARRGAATPPDGSDDPSIAPRGRAALADPLLDLAAMPTPAGRGAAGRRPRRAELRGLGLEVDEDGAGAEIGSNAGQPYAGSSRPRRATPLFLCAHIDTVPPTGPIEPVVEDGVVRNAGGTILGADNKSAVAAMVEARAAGRRESGPHAGIELALHAEGGGRPARRRGVRLLAARRAGRATSTTRPGPIGEVDPRRAVPAMIEVTLPRPLRARRHGAGGRPLRDRGRGRAIADMRLGRLDEETTANVGMIQGGVARNIVPDRCSFDGRGALPRRAQARGRRPGDARRFLVRRHPRRMRGRDRGRSAASTATASEGRRAGAARAAALERSGLRADLRALGRRGRRQRLQRARPRLPEPRQRHGGDPHAPGAHRRRRPRGDGRGHARAPGRRARAA